MTATLTLHVSSTGDDHFSGSEDAPLASLEGARDRIRSLPSASRVRVILHGGTYPLERKVVFEPQDGREGDGWVRYEAACGETPVFTSGVPLQSWEKLPANYVGVSANAEGRIWVADVPPKLGSFKTLFDGASELPRSRSAGFCPLGECPSGETALGPLWYAADPTSLPCPAGIWEPIVNPEEVEVRLIPIAPWAMNILPVASVNRETHHARLAIPATYAPVRPLFGEFPEGSAWLENDLALITKSGHWAVNRAEGKIYLWPISDEPGRKIYAPALIELIAVSGRLDEGDQEDHPVRGLHFHGLKFTQADRYTVPPDRTGWGVQHDWEQFDQPTAAMRFRGAEDCSVQGCDFTALGGTAIRLDLHCQKITVAKNTIADVGGTGVFLCGYGLGTKDVNHSNVVEDNAICRVGRHYCDSPAIFLWQSGGNLVAHNKITSVPYAGIVVSGRIVWDSSGKEECSRTIRWPDLAAAFGTDLASVRNSPEPDWTVRERFLHARNNRIEKNDISNVVEVMSDGNAIYISGAGAGNLVQGNYIHDIPSKNLTEAIRCDDDQHRTQIRGNVMFRFGGYATAVASKGINDIIGNLIVWPLQSTKRGLISLELGPVSGSRICDNIVVAAHPKDRAVFQERSYGDGPIPRLADCQADHNLYWNVCAPEWAKPHLDREQKLGVETNSHAVDPCFEDLERGDFRLRSDSPLHALAFAVPDINDAGPHPR